MSVHLELQIKLLEQERVELREEIIKLKLDKQELEKQLNLCGVSQQRELLEFFVETQASELFKTQTGYKYKPNAIEETIKNFNCGIT